MINSYPLSWPDGWKRSRDTKHGKFTRQGQWLTVFDGIARVLAELERVGVGKDDVVISTNVPTRLDGLPRSNMPEPSDRGAAVYWRTGQNKPMQCMAIDIYNTVADNLGAIAATLAAMRAIERHGGAQVQERVFRGFAALPEKTGRPWRDVLAYGNHAASVDQIESTYRMLAKTRHPDMGGSHDAMAELNQAREEALAEVTQ